MVCNNRIIFVAISISFGIVKNKMLNKKLISVFIVWPAAIFYLLSLLMLIKFQPMRNAVTHLISLVSLNSVYLNIESFIVSLHSRDSRHKPAITAVEGGCHWPLKKRWKFPLARVPTTHCIWGMPDLYLGQPFTKDRCQPIGGHVSYYTDSPRTTRLWLYGCLTGIETHIT